MVATVGNVKCSIDTYLPSIMLAPIAFTCVRRVCFLIGSHEMPLEPTQPAKTLPSCILRMRAVANKKAAMIDGTKNTIKKMDLSLMS